MYSLPISQKIRYQLRHIIANRYQRQDAKEPFRLPRHVFPEPWLISLAVLLLILLVFVLHIVFDQNQIRLRYPNIFPVVLLNFFILVFRIYVKGNWHWIHIKTLAWLKTAAFVFAGIVKPCLQQKLSYYLMSLSQIFSKDLLWLLFVLLTVTYLSVKAF